MDKKLAKQSFLNALGTVAYIILIALVMSGLEKFISNEPDGFFAPVLFLTLFVLSAAITAGLVLGKPVMMFLAGERKEAVTLFVYTLGWLLVAVMILLFVNII